MDAQYVPVSSGDNFLGAGGLGALLIGALLFGGGFGGFGNRGVAGLEGLNAVQQQINTLSDQVASNATNSFLSASTISTNQAIDNNARQILSELGNLGTAVASGNFTTLPEHLEQWLTFERNVTNDLSEIVLWLEDNKFIKESIIISKLVYDAQHELKKVLRIKKRLELTNYSMLDVIRVSDKLHKKFKKLEK